MELLSYRTLGTEASLSRRMPERVLQFGDGNFLRGFVDDFIDQMNEKADFDKMFSKVRTQFFAVAENYPELKASENFLQLQRSLNETEEQLAAARRTYNASITDYNNAVQTFPTNLLAGMFGFTRKAVLTIPEAERVTPDVKNLFNS